MRVETPNSIITAVSTRYARSTNEGTRSPDQREGNVHSLDGLLDG